MKVGAFKLLLISSFSRNLEESFRNQQLMLMKSSISTNERIAVSVTDQLQTFLVLVQLKNCSM